MTIVYVASIFKNKKFNQSFFLPKLVLAIIGIHTWVKQLNNFNKKLNFFRPKVCNEWGKSGVKPSFEELQSGK